MAGCCASGNELSGLTKFGEILEQLRNCYLFKEERVPVSWVISWLVIQLDGYTVILPPKLCFLTAGLWAYSRISSAFVCMDTKFAVPTYRQSNNRHDTCFTRCPVSRLQSYWI